jgi:hypothetical protein
MVDDIGASNRFCIIRATTDIHVLNTTSTHGTRFEKSSARQANIPTEQRKRGRQAVQIICRSKRQNLLVACQLQKELPVLYFMNNENFSRKFALQLKESCN